MPPRRAVPADLEAVQSISADAYIRAYLPVIGAIPKPAREDYHARVERGEVWVLEADGSVVGLIVLEEQPDHLLVYSIAVRPDRQGRGYGKVLLRFADEEARRNGMREVRLYTNRRMARNLALYRRCGFAEIGTRPHPSHAGEVLIDMAKTL
jgi:ribosomal protein S18 acetylase RimI-like enzyme